MLSLKFKIFFAVIIFANICVWFYARPLKTEWRNVPTAPSEFSAHAAGLGDENLAYRMIGFMLQNIGKVDGRTQNLNSYDYSELEGWFFRAYNLLPQSGYVPLLATYYYGAASDAEKLRHVVNFLKVAGNDTAKDRWRWLVHAIFLARYKIEDFDLAYELADILEKLDSPHKPQWTNLMPAMVKNAKGEKEDAYIMMKAILESSAQSLDPAEINHIIGYICEQILTPEEAEKDKICELNKG